MHCLVHDALVFVHGNCLCFRGASITSFTSRGVRFVYQEQYETGYIMAFLIFIIQMVRIYTGLLFRAVEDHLQRT